MAFPRPKHGINLESLVLKSGGHASKRAGMCVMEAANNYHHGIHGYHTVKYCPEWIRKRMIHLNDRADHEERQTLKVFIPLLIMRTKSDHWHKAPRGFRAHFSRAMTWKAERDALLKAIRAARAKVLAERSRKKAIPTKNLSLKTHPVETLMEDFSAEVSSSPSKLKSHN